MKMEKKERTDPNQLSTLLNSTNQLKREREKRKERESKILTREDDERASIHTYSYCTPSYVLLLLLLYYYSTTTKEKRKNPNEKNRATY